MKNQGISSQEDYIFLSKDLIRFTYNDIVNKTEAIINDKLKVELMKYTNITIENIEVQTVYEGSIEILFTATIKLLEMAGGLKNLYDVINLIKEISQRFIRKCLKTEFGTDFEVRVYKIVAEYDYRLEYTHRSDREERNRQPERDAFFYYLLVANIILLLMVGFMVFSAVWTVYFN